MVNRNLLGSNPAVARKGSESAAEAADGAGAAGQVGDPLLAGGTGLRPPRATVHFGEKRVKSVPLL